MNNNTQFNLFKSAREIDTGQQTTNPFVLVKRAMALNKPLNLDVLNSILAFNNITLTQQEFDYFTNIKPTTIPYPIPANNESVISIIGSASNKGKGNPKSGVYVIESLDKSDNYVGSSNNLALRLRYYSSKKGIGENRPVAKAFANKGPSIFKITVYVLDLDNIKSLNISMSIEDLTLAFEQYMIILTKPTLNVLTVVNSTPSIHSTYKQVGSSVYMYNTDNTLIYTSESGRLMEKQLGLTVYTVNRNIKSGKYMYGKYLFSRTPIESASIDLLDLDTILENLKWCYKNRAKLRDYTNTTTKITPITLTNLLDNSKYYFISKRKACFYTQQFSIDRHVNQLDIIKLKLPFTYKNWLFESTHKSPQVSSRWNT